MLAAQFLWQNPRLAWPVQTLRWSTGRRRPKITAWTEPACELEGRGDLTAH